MRQVINTMEDLSETARSSLNALMLEAAKNEQVELDDSDGVLDVFEMGRNVRLSKEFRELCYAIMLEMRMGM